MKPIYFLIVALVTMFLISAPELLKSAPVAPEYSLDSMAFSHDEAVVICESLNMVYNYEAEGQYAFDFCDAPANTPDMEADYE